MPILALILLLLIAPALGVILGSNVRAATDPGYALYRRAAGGRARPPGSLFPIPGRLRKLPLTRPGAYRVARGVALRAGRGGAAGVGAASAGAGAFQPGTSTSTGPRYTPAEGVI